MPAAETIHCRKCGAELAPGATCDICAGLARIRTLAEAKRRRFTKKPVGRGNWWFDQMARGGESQLPPSDRCETAELASTRSDSGSEVGAP